MMGREGFQSPSPSLRPFSPDLNAVMFQNNMFNSSTSSPRHVQNLNQPVQNATSNPIFDLSFPHCQPF